jgi:O-antigen/teichoic acid export membrane protein
VTPFDARGAFVPVGGDGLRRAAVRSAGVTVLSQSTGFLIQMAATIVLARLLAPADFGLLTMVTTFSLLFMNFGLNGFTEAVLQREDIDHALASNLFWINVGVGVLLTIGFASAAPLLSHFYADPRLARVVPAMSLTIFFTSLSVIHLALLKRAMRFAVVSANDIAARAVSVAVSIGLGWAAFGYWALVAGAIALPFVNCVGAWARCRWLPALPRRRPGTGQMLRFALNTYTRFAATYFTWNLDNLLVGWRFGPAALGFYKRAYDLFVLPMNQLSSPLTAVAVSSLSRLGRDPAQQRRYVLRALSLLAFVGMGIGACLTLTGKDLIFVLLGPRWGEAGRIFTMFGPGIGAMLLYATHGWIHLSIGRPDRWFRWGVVELTFTAVAFLLGLRWGPGGVAAAWVVSYWTLTIPALCYAGRPVRLTARSVASIVSKYGMASLGAGIGAAALAGLLPTVLDSGGIAGAISRIAATAMIFLPLYIAAVVLLHRGLAPIHLAAAVARDIVAPRRAPLLTIDNHAPFAPNEQPAMAP